MFNKTLISPWSDNFYSDFQSQLKQTLIERSAHKKNKEILVEISRKFPSDSEFPKSHIRKIRPSETEIQKHKSISLNKNFLSLDSNPEIQLSKHERRFSSNLPTQQKQPYLKSISDRNQKFITIPISTQQLSSKVDRPFFEFENSRLHGNQTYLFSICKKQQIRWQCRQNSDQQKLDQQQIFKKVNEISRKRKKQIKLPRISVAYSMQRILQ